MEKNITARKLLLSMIDTTHLRSKRKTADNIKIKRNFFKKGFVRLRNICAYNKQLW